MKEQPTIAIVGLGYVGLPLAVAFAEKYRIIGFDISEERIEQLNNGKDLTLEVSEEDLMRVLEGNENTGLEVTVNPDDMSEATVFIVTVPTPTNKYNQPE